MIIQEDNHVLIKSFLPNVIRPVELINACKFLSYDQGFQYLLGIELNNTIMTYHFYSLELKMIHSLNLTFNESENIPSISLIYPSALPVEVQLNKRSPGLISIPEKEGLFKTFNIPQIKKNPNKSELPFVEESYQFYVKKFQEHGNVLLATSSNNQIIEASLEETFFDENIKAHYLLEFYHKDLKKLDFHSQLVCYMALEEALGIKLKERVIALRMLFSEIERIIFHLKSTTQLLQLTSFKDEKLLAGLKVAQDLYHLITHKEQEESILCLGGIERNLPSSWIHQTYESIKFIDKQVQDFQLRLSSEQEFKNILSFGPINAIEAMKWGLSGVYLRASGVNFDLRKHASYYFYKELNLELSLGITGNGLARTQVAMGEVLSSLGIIVQIIDNLPLGRVKEDLSFDDFDEASLNQISAKSFVEAPEGMRCVVLKESGQLSLLNTKNNRLLACQEILKGRPVDEIDLIFHSFVLNQKD